MTLYGRKDNSIIMDVSTSESARQLDSAKEGKSNVVSIVSYLQARVDKLRSELQRVEKQTGLMMNQLIREIDHSVARRLQRDIGRLDSYHAELNKRIKQESSRYKRYVEIETSGSDL